MRADLRTDRLGRTAGQLREKIDQADKQARFYRAEALRLDGRSQMLLRAASDCCRRRAAAMRLSAAGLTR